MSNTFDFEALKAQAIEQHKAGRDILARINPKVMVQTSG